MRGESCKKEPGLPSCHRQQGQRRGLKQLAGLTAGFLLWSAAAARADAVVDWNAIASDAVAAAVAAGRPSQATLLDMAMVHVAIHDAIQAIEHRFNPYHASIARASGSRTAAAAKAAHDVLVYRFPALAAALDATYDDYLASHGLAPDDAGVLAGQAAAADIISLRENDGSFPANAQPFTGGTDIGMWRPTASYNLPPGAPPGTAPGPPASFAPMAVPWLGSVVPFTLTTPTQFRPAPPPAIHSLRYLLDYLEVKAFGSLSSRVRTPEQTDLGYFYADNFGLLWNRALRTIASEHVRRIGDSARLFALASLAMADAVITAWDSKLHFAFWRPVTAIQEGANDGNPLTIGDPTWQPLINTPNYPDYTSGANNLTGAITEILALFFDTDEMAFDVTSAYPLAAQKTRTYQRFSDAARDVVNVRVYQGIHFRTADIVARRQGIQVARWTFDHFLEPREGHEHRRHNRHTDLVEESDSDDAR